MEFDFDCASLLQVDEEGIAVIDAQNPPSYFRSAAVGFGPNAFRQTGGYLGGGIDKNSSP